MARCSSRRSRVATNTNRSWNDLTFPAGDPQARQLLARLRLDESGGQRLECGAWSNQNFGKYTVSTTYDPNVLSGWNVREYSWDLTAGIQQEIAPRTSLEVTYVRRSWGNQTVTDNRAVTAADFDRFSLTAPADSRLPNGGGYRVEGIYDVKPAKFGQVDNFVTFAKNFGQGRIETYNGVDVNVSARPRGGLTLQGGLNIGQSRLNDCDVWAQLPEIIAPGFPFARTPEAFCDQSSGWQVSFGGLASYIVPKVDVQVAATIQSRPFAGANFPGIASQSLAANWLVSNSLVVPELGRSLAGNAQLISANLVEPGTMYGDRLNQVDFRVSKILRFGDRTGERRRGSVQSVQHQRRLCVFPDAQHGDSGDLPAAGVARRGAVRQSERAVRLLIVRARRSLRMPWWCGGFASENIGAPGRTRTCGPRLRRPVLYPTELRARGVELSV